MKIVYKSSIFNQIRIKILGETRTVTLTRTSRTPNIKKHKTKEGNIIQITKRGPATNRYAGRGTRTIASTQAALQDATKDINQIESSI